VHGAAGWQMNDAALALEQEFGFSYASDTRGVAPFVPLLDGRRSRCPQLPTTLPTLDELIGTDGLTAETACDRLRACARASSLPAQVFTLHAELEGGQLAPQFERLLTGWLADGLSIVPMVDLATSLRGAVLPRHRIEMGEIPGRSGVLAVQGPQVADAAIAC
jgi:peptidoglycan/xylan/chitin deacetylase (PgdA/CDA1 family)